MKAILGSLLPLLVSFLIPLQGLATAKPRVAGNDSTQPPGQFDTYILAMSYQNDFCLTQPSSASCKPGEMDGMTLHGLWPDRNTDYKNTYQFCGYSESWVNKQKWCSAAIDVKSQMQPGELDSLGQIMPGVETCLYNHEWYAHGTCSGLNVADYFQDATVLATRFHNLPQIQALIRSSAGQTLEKAQIIAALTADLGSQAEASFVVMCRNVGGKSYFSQINVGLDRQKLMEFPAAESFAPIKPYPDKNGVPEPDQGTCPDAGILISL